jgi:S-formylglutathione hydrolase FrmB
MRPARLLMAIVCALTAALGLVASAEAAGGFAYGPDQLELQRTERLNDRLFELTFRTPAVEDETGVRILLPDGYDADADRRYPVLYLLHGCCEGNTGYRGWTDELDAERVTAGWPLIVVMPDSGPNGGYVDWYNHGAGGPPMWETYHIGQLLPWVDQHFRTVSQREARAVAGLSMGGFGTMHYAARHPDLFVAAASFSGAVDSNSVFLHAVSSADGLSTGDPPSSANGLRATEEVRWRGHNPYDLAENLEGMDLTLRTGTGEPGGPGGEPGDCCYDPVEAEVHEENMSLHERFAELGIPHTWDDYGPGCHCGFYWTRDLEQLMPHLAWVFGDPLAPPSPFTYRSIDPAYEAYGWRVHMDRQALEWSELRDARRDGFALRGSGSGSVTTPPLYAPGRTVDVQVARGEGVESKRVRVPDDCRLRLAVPLGPGNPHQQYTAQARVHGIQESLETPGTAPSDDTSGTAVYTTRVRIGAERTPGCPRVESAVDR